MRAHPPSPSRPNESVEEIRKVAAHTVDRASPTLRVEHKWGIDWRVGAHLVVCVVPYTHHVGVEFYRGSSLTDPKGLLEGTGKNLRHVKLRTRVEARSPALAALVRAAVRLDSEPARRPRKA